MVAELRLERDEVAHLISALERELKRLRKKLRVVERELRSFEERYGMSTDEFVRMYEECRGGRGRWRLPEEADLDAIEWRGLATVREELLEEMKSLANVLTKLRRAM